MKQHYQGMLETESRDHETVQYGRYLKVHTGKLEMKYKKNASLSLSAQTALTRVESWG